MTGKRRPKPTTVAEWIRDDLIKATKEYRKKLRRVDTWYDKKCTEIISRCHIPNTVVSKAKPELESKDAN